MILNITSLDFAFSISCGIDIYHCFIVYSFVPENFSFLLASILFFKWCFLYINLINREELWKK